MAGWTVRDLLCTATHLIAESVALALRKSLPDDAAVDEILVTGGGRHNGMLLRKLAQWTEVSLTPLDETDIAAEVLGAASVALLAMLHFDGVAANGTGMTARRRRAFSAG